MLFPLCMASSSGFLASSASHILLLITRLPPAIPRQLKPTQCLLKGSTHSPVSSDGAHKASWAVFPGADTTQEVPV